MYKSPIELFITDIKNQIIKQQDEDIYQAVLHYIPNVDKEELIRALQYDRGQYGKGYADGKRDAMESLVHCEDCGHHSDNGCPDDRVWCRRLSRYMDTDGFCSYGERKDNE